MQLDSTSSMGDESSLLRTLDILRRRKLIAVLVFAATLATAISFALYLPDLFRATAVVLVERQLPETFVRGAVSGELESRLHTIKQEVLSRARLTDLLSRFDLYPALRADGDLETAIDHMRRDIQIELTGPEQLNGRTKTVAFNLSFTAGSRDTVAPVTNAIAAFYVAQNNQMRSDEASRTAQFLKSQLEDAKKQLGRQEADVRAYTNRHVGELPQQVEVNLATLERLNTQLRLNGERQLRTLDQREKLFEGLPLTAVASRSDLPSPAMMRLNRLQEELGQLEGFPDKHPDVKRLRDEIATLKQELQDEPRDITPVTPARTGARTLESLDAELEKLKNDDDSLRRTIASLEQRLEGVPYRQNEFALISRDHQAVRELYDSLLKRYEEAQLAQSMETENQGERFRILEMAADPVGPSAPNRPRLLIMGLFLALLAAGLATLIVEQFDTSFHTMDDLRQFTAVPVLGSIPRIGGPRVDNWLSSAWGSASMVVGLTLIATLSAYLARGNEELVRLFVRGG